MVRRGAPALSCGWCRRWTRSAAATTTARRGAGDGEGAAIALFSRGVAREHRLAGARTSQATALLGLRRYEETLETISATEWAVARGPHRREVVGVIAATALGDTLAAARWPAYAEFVPPGMSEVARAMLRLLPLRAPRPEQRAAGQRHRDAFAVSTYPSTPCSSHSTSGSAAAGRRPRDRPSRGCPQARQGRRRTAIPPENRPSTAFRDVPETAILRPPAALGARASDDWA